MTDDPTYDYYCLWEGYCEYVDPDIGKCKYGKPCDEQERIPEMILFIGNQPIFNQ